ncbi:flagellar basal body-associated FliL family protein (plasmid) [Paracoccus sp. TK19116]|uniref:Flagellar basal body-associated FliL family protein n=1 Tax=Paracoccus albicereus TaxID=2922394 RepID=A0ABT1MLE9_9RHOB|nr:flagellar basal body-associated FliL family protein [Paracoccus albicereus]MCQ0969117.1 flagellar basal body-associated FliL family protein [Paracoccus albicereus]
MIGKILFLVLPVAAFLGGSAGGAMLRGDETVIDGGHGEVTAEGHATEAEAGGHDAEPAAAPVKTAKADMHGGGHGEAGSGAVAWFNFPSQFFVPVVRNGNTDYTMILTLTLETPGEALSGVEALEHRLRDAMLRQLIIHANTGGFDGNYTSEGQLRKLRDALLAAARSAGGDGVDAVLIEDIARKEG